jgi:hypothetical protein
MWVTLITILGVLVEVYHLYKLRNGGALYRFSINPTSMGG